jgi:hypothetical protein
MTRNAAILHPRLTQGNPRNFRRNTLSFQSFKSQRHALAVQRAATG